MLNKKIYLLLTVFFLVILPVNSSDYYTNGADSHWGISDADWCDIPKEDCTIACDNIIDYDGIVTRGIHVRAYLEDDSSDNCLAPTNSELGIVDGKEGVKINNGEEGGDNKEMDGIVDFSDLKQLDVSVTIKNENNLLTITSNNKYHPACEGTRIEWKSYCNEGNVVKCKCNKYNNIPEYNINKEKDEYLEVHAND